MLRRMRYLLRHRQQDAELAEELEFHRHMKQRELERQGVEPSEAAFAVRRAVGNERAARERARDLWIWPWLRDAAHDLRFAARLLVKNRGFTLVAVTTLALGIGAGGTVFTIVNAMIFRGLPVESPDRIVTFNDPAGGPLSISYRDLEDWRAQVRAFAGLAAYRYATITVGDPGRSPEVFSSAYVSADAFRILGERPALGRDFLPEDDRPGAASAVILGGEVWKSRYGSDPAIVGRTIRINGAPSVVVGIMSDGFEFPLISDLWQPLAQMPGLVTDRRDARVLMAFGRLAPDAAMTQARSEMTTVAARLAREFPATNKDIVPAVAPFTGTASHPMFLALLGAVAFVLLIACSNVANLLLGRSAHRSREISIRSSLGASRSRVLRQLLIESLSLAVLAGVMGYLLSILGVGLFANAVAGIKFPYWYRDRWTMDGSVFMFLAIVSLATVVIFGLAPAWHVSKTNVTEALKEGARTGTSGRTARWWTSGLLVAEVAFTLTLLTAAGLMMDSFLAVYRADRVVDAPRVLTMLVRPPTPKYENPEQRAALYRRIEDRLDAIPLISAATLASHVPFIGAPHRGLAIDGRPPATERPPLVSYVSIGSRYFDTLGVRLLRGRPFSQVDGTPGHESAIINQRLADMHFAGEDPIGRRIQLTNPNTAGAAPLRATIVGVSPTVRQQYLSDLDPVVYVPFRADPPAIPWLMVRAQADSDAVTSLVRDEIRAMDPDLPMYGVAPLELLMGQSRWGHRVFGTMFAVFAGIALVLSAVGLYAVTAYGVTQRTHEIGLRMALGAQGSQVLSLFVRRSMVPLAIGLGVGFAGAFGVGRLLESMLVQTTATDPATLLSVAAVLTIVAVAACVLPARRAARLDPLAALRHE